ncbi:hypothetical protein [Flavobacterium sp.]|uniref:hypothetical protein n=1 Tax=Flavobacterium sp. TaxID=239 RepID=UPI002615CBE9|nr:hypothetical protein [Flavobacterium sp.]
MQLLVKWNVVEGTDPTAVINLLPKEEFFAWNAYLSGTLRQFWLTQNPGEVIMIQEFDSLEHAVKANQNLPLMKAGMLKATWFELKPFQSWEFLFASEFKTNSKNVMQ